MLSLKEFEKLYEDYQSVYDRLHNFMQNSYLARQSGDLDHYAAEAVANIDEGERMGQFNFEPVFYAVYGDTRFLENDFPDEVECEIESRNESLKQFALNPGAPFVHEDMRKHLPKRELEKQLKQDKYNLGELHKLYNKNGVQPTNENLWSLRPSQVKEILDRQPVLYHRRRGSNWQLIPLEQIATAQSPDDIDQWYMSARNNR